METKDISLFLAIARIGSISKTAEQLFMSQSTVTTRLQRLERNLGYNLFERTQNGVQLTTRGLRFVSLAEQIEQIEKQMQSPRLDETPLLRVMSGRAFVSTDVPECLHRMLKHATVHLQVRMGLYDEMKDALLAQQVDFCFLGEPIYHPNIRLVEFAPDAVDLIVPETHYLCYGFNDIRQIQAEPFVAFGRPTSPFRQRIMTLLAKSHVYPNVIMELDSFDGVKAMVSHGLGVSLLPRRTLFDADAKGYQVLSLNSAAWSRPTYLAFPKAIEKEPLIEQFLKVATEFYSQLQS